MADDDEAIDAQVDVDDAIKTLLEATRSQATVNAALVTQLMNINTTQLSSAAGSDCGHSGSAARAS